MEDDRKLLELAAKAAGIVHEGFDEDEGRDVWWLPYLSRYDSWNPLDDDGDALRLAVKLRLQLKLLTYISAEITAFGALCAHGAREYLRHVPDEFASVRRAIVRAAAEIGRAME